MNQIYKKLKMITQKNRRHIFDIILALCGAAILLTILQTCNEQARISKRIDELEQEINTKDSLIIKLEGVKYNQ